MNNNEKELYFEAEDCNDPMWIKVVEILKTSSDFVGVRYADGNNMSFVFKNNI